MAKNRTRATIKSVARQAGVSVATVSRVINGHSGITAARRDAVLKAVRELDYRPSDTARELSLGRVTRVGLNFGNGPLLMRSHTLLRDHLYAELFQRGLQVETVASNSAGLPGFLPDALIVGSLFDDDPRLRYLSSENVPVVLHGHREGFFSVTSDDYEGGRLAANHLLELGHERIAFLTGGTNRRQYTPLSYYTMISHDRFRGFRDALAARGIGFDPAAMLDGGYEPLASFRAVRDALQSGLSFTAIFALSDEMAYGAMQALVEAGKQVPRDVSIVGFDDMPGFGDHITTIRQDVGALAHNIADLLTQAVEGRPPVQRIIPVQLVTRGTTMRVC
ncbi:LacI family DNA-binding transcriptional regulator [Yunchengibacter salinarum]|uniref:LacI family DNA-binding transcriptional regulator n=1 Tax=Yunchengibacter salinarum TaxID=3133399 RepID=UPI0035B5AC8C